MGMVRAATCSTTGSSRRIIMPLVNNHEVRIHYELDGTGPPLVLLHGFTPSLEIWYDLGWVQALRDAYQLILIDARGHGASDKPHTPDAYRMTHMVADVTAVLDHLGIDQAHVLGYSMGGGTCFGLATYAPERLRSLLIGGADGQEGDPDQPDPLAEHWLAALRAHGIAGLEPDWDAGFAGWMTPALKARFLANDADAFIAYLSCRERVGLTDGLASVTVPCLLFAGTEDDCHAGAQQAAARLPNATFVSLPGLDHMQGWSRVDLVLPHIRRFLQQVDAAGGSKHLVSEGGGREERPHADP
jgi:pimeloyl-ACP methyl ester carboxylesterase